MSARTLHSFTVAGFDSGGTSMIARIDHQPGMDHEQALNEYRQAALKWNDDAGWFEQRYKFTWTYILLNAHAINPYSERVKVTFLADWEHVQTLDLERSAEEEVQL